MNAEDIDLPCDLSCAASRRDHTTSEAHGLAELVHEEAHPVVPNPT